MERLVDMVYSLLPLKKMDVFGREQWMKTSIPYYVLPLIGILALPFLETEGWFFVMFVYTAIPILDEIFIHDIKNPTQEERKQLERQDFSFKMALYVTVIVDWLIFFKVMQYCSEVKVGWTLQTFNLIGLIFVFSNYQTAQLATAHQIFHKQDKFHRYLGTFHMIKNLYTHFTLEHLNGHHKKVATPEDPASAPQGQTVYQFIPKYVAGQFKNVYEMEQQQGKMLIMNAAFLSVMASAAFTLMIYYFYGMQATICFVIQAVLSIVYLGGINYIEHYGLRREKLANGEYEKVNIRHSWNAPHRFTNYFFFKLQRHSDHHENSLKPYQTLVSLDQSPHLPHGYSLMILMCFFPKVWFSIMDPLVNEYKRLKVGTAKTELIQKATTDTKKFIIRVGLVLMAFWAISSIRI